MYVCLLFDLTCLFVVVFLQELENGANWEELLTSALTQLAAMLNDEKTLSVFEVQASNLVSALLTCFTMVMCV